MPLFQVWDSDATDESDSKEWEQPDAEMAALAHAQRTWAATDCPERMTICTQDDAGTIHKFNIAVSMEPQFRAERKAK